MISPKWQTMWVESQHCPKSIVNMPLPSEQAKKVLEDLKNSCCSPNKAVQIEALKCWGVWIHNQNPNDWKLNVVCFSAVRPLVTKKLQPLHRDVDICKLKLSLLWALLVKVQEIMHLEGPQYIFEVFLQSCLTWLSSTHDHHNENKINLLIFQLLLAVFNKDEIDFDNEMFPPLSTDVLQIKKVFLRLADKFLNIFVHWKSVEDKSVAVKIWKRFLEHCEVSHEHIPIPVWHRVFKLVGEISTENDSPVKERLAFLHGCATTLKSALSSSKFIDFSNLLTTPCEVLLRKLVELCSLDCNEFRDSEMFFQSKQICQVLSQKSVAISGYDLCIVVVDALEDFRLRSLFWGVWCGLVYCYKTLLKDIEHERLTKNETKFYRKLRGIAVNFELDKNYLHEDCVHEVEKHIGFLNINCVCAYRDNCKKVTGESEIVAKTCENTFGKFSLVPYSAKKNKISEKVINVNFDLLKNILNGLKIDSMKSLLDPGFDIRRVNMPTTHRGEIVPRNMSFQLKVEVDPKNKLSLIVSCHGAKVSLSPNVPAKRHAATRYDDDETSDEDAISIRKTRSKKRAEEEKKSEMHKRKKRKSFEVLVQEIVRKNKERKTEKNSKRRKSPEAVKGKRNRRRIERRERNKENQKIHNLREKDNQSERSCRLLRSRTKEEPAKTQKKKDKKKIQSVKTDGKLENYFKVITKKCSNGKEIKKPSKSKTKRKTSENCCNAEKDEKERKGEVGWKQTSLKTMMNPKSRMEKVKQGTQTREKVKEITEERAKARNEERKVLDSPLAKLSPFKEVFHDHEYAKINPENLKTYQRVFMTKNEKNKLKEKVTKQVFEKTPPKCKPVEKVNLRETVNIFAEKKTKEKTESEFLDKKQSKVEAREAKNADIEKKTLKSNVIEIVHTVSEKKQSKVDPIETKNLSVEKKTSRTAAIETANAVSVKRHKKLNVIETKTTNSKIDAIEMVISEKKLSKVDVIETKNATTEKKTSKPNATAIVNTVAEKKQSKSDVTESKNATTEQKHTKVNALETKTAKSKTDAAETKTSTTEKNTSKPSATEMVNSVSEKKYKKVNAIEIKTPNSKIDSIEIVNAISDEKHTKIDALEAKTTTVDKKTFKIAPIEIVNAVVENKTLKINKPEMEEKMETEPIKSFEQNLEINAKVSKHPPQDSNPVVEENEKLDRKIIDCDTNPIEENVEIVEEFFENDSNPERKGKKRFRTVDGMKSRKKVKLGEEETEDIAEEKLPLEVTEKENLEEKQSELISPVKRDKTGNACSKNNGSPKAVNGGMSRALRIIGLVPESTMGRSWESSPRVEALKCKKAPNVDKNSRASKMLALLSENVVEADEVVKISEEEINCSGLVVATPPSVKTLLSSLKSPKSIKKRKSIGFDDARNETVIYQINTPPSQILEEKRRGTRPFEVALHLP